MAIMADNAVSLDKEFITNRLSSVLAKAHSNLHKREIKFFPERMNVACPICGDSEKSSTKKRGNLYYKNLMYKCFNCGRFTSFTKLCEHFSVDIPLDKRLQLYDYIDSNTYFTQANDDYVITKLDKLIKLDDFIHFYNTHPEHKLTNIKPVEKGSPVYQYLLLNRKIVDDPNLYEGIYHYTDTWSEPVVVILNRHKNKLMGIQLRNLKDEKKKRFYKIYEFDDIYKPMYPDNPMDEFETIAYNKLSHFINILNVDFSKPVTIFEGYFDSKFYPNSVGIVGVNTDLSFLQKDKSLKIRFFYDNDEDGYKAARKKLSEGYEVFLWKLLFKNIIKNKKDKYEAQKRLSKIKDLNKLAMETNTPPYELLKLDKYFSRDNFDMLYLDTKTSILSLI